MTAKAGLGEDAVRYGSGCTWVDYDRDGRLDLFVANYLDTTLEKLPKPGENPDCRWKGVPVNCGPRGLPTGFARLYPQQRRRHVHRRQQALRRRGGLGVVSDDRGGRRLRQRRLARHLRRLRLHAELAVPQPARRHVPRGGARARRRAERRRPGAGGHGHRRRRLRPRRQPRHLQDALLRRHQRPLPQRRQGLLRRRHHPRRPRRRDALRRVGSGDGRPRQRRPPRPVRGHRQRLPGGRADSCPPTRSGRRGWSSATWATADSRS